MNKGNFAWAYVCKCCKYTSNGHAKSAQKDAVSKNRIWTWTKNKYMFVSQYTNVYTDIGNWVRDKCKYITTFVYLVNFAWVFPNE